MNKLKNLICISILIIGVGCKKKSQDTIGPTPVTGPVITYIDLSGKTLSLGQIVNLDLDGDKIPDLYFYTQSVADNLNSLVKDKFIAGSRIAFNLNYSSDAAGEDMLASLAKGQDIKPNTNAETWFNVGEAVMMQQVENTAINKITWQGNWADKGHLYLPFQQKKDGNIYYGWVELEASTAQQKLIFYKAAIGQDAGVSVKAGA